LILLNKYDLRQMLADIEEDLIVQHEDTEQQVNINQSVITALLLKKSAGTGNDHNKKPGNN
jgi:hypothetical protein